MLPFQRSFPIDAIAGKAAINPADNNPYRIGRLGSVVRLTIFRYWGVRASNEAVIGAMTAAHRATCRLARIPNTRKNPAIRPNVSLGFSPVIAIRAMTVSYTHLGHDQPYRLLVN